MKKLYIIAGPPGSGKSTIAKKLAQIVFETDNYWLNCVGEYLFVPSKIPDAHKWNQDNVKKALKEGTYETIAVANTNLSPKERRIYVTYAKQFGYEPELVLPESPWFKEILPRILDKTFTDEDVQVFVNKNIHKVPFESIKNMLNRFDISEL